MDLIIFENLILLFLFYHYINRHFLMRYIIQKNQRKCNWEKSKQDIWNNFYRWWIKRSIIRCTVKVKTSEALNESLNEYVQLGDTVKYNKEKGYIIGEIEGKYIVQVQGNTYYVDPKEVKEWAKKADITVQPHMKFDEKTQKLLFEQYVKCGIFHGNVPIKMNDCYVRYSSWESANPEQQIKVLVEGNNTFVSKSQIRIFEDVNDFANEDNYVPGVIIDEVTENVIENVLVNAIDYTQAIGDSDGVKIIRQTPDGQQEFQTMPKSSIRTLSV